MLRKFLKEIFFRLPVLIRQFFIYLMPPNHMVFEVTNICNLKCPLCPTQYLKRKKIIVPYEKFSQVLNYCSSFIKTISFYLLGEPLLNKDIFKMIKLCGDKGIISNFSTNDMFLGKYYKEIIDSKLNFIQVTLDGIDKESHEEYRVGSDFDKCIENIKLLTGYRNKKLKKTPYIRLQTLLFKNNIGKIENFIELAKKLGVDGINFKKVTLGRRKNIIKKNKDKFLGNNKEFDRTNNFADLYRNNLVCPEIYRKLYIVSNGDVILCCFDSIGEIVIGNVYKKKSVFKIWYSFKRFNLIGQVLRHELEICKNCDGAYNSNISYKI